MGRDRTGLVLPGPGARRRPCSPDSAFRLQPQRRGGQLGPLPDPSDLIRREGVAVVGITGVVSGGQPPLAALRRSVGPAVGADPALGGLLDPVVADDLGGVERLVQRRRSPG